MKILVTGGLGFIGSHIVDRLVSSGHDVATVDDLSSALNAGTASNLVPSLRIDLRQLRRSDLRDVEAVVHCAAHADVRQNWRSDADRAHLWASNLDGTRALLEAMPSVPLVFLSTAAVYGSNRGEWRQGGATEGEASPETCESPYAASKLACEAMLAAYAHRRGTPWHALRLVNVVGSRTRHGVIADFVRMAHAGRIHAADDGNQTKPWVHVGDVVNSVHACLFGGVPQGTYNVTSHELISWWDVVNAMGVPHEDVTYEDRDRGCVGDPHSLRVSGQKLAPFFQPRRSPHAGIVEALSSLGWSR